MKKIYYLVLFLFCVNGAAFAQKGAKNIALMESADGTEEDEEIQEKILIPISNSETIDELINLGVTIKSKKNRDGLYALSIINNNNVDGFSEEAEWCFGLAWLAIIYAERGDKEKAYYYLRRTKNAVTPEGVVPELYYSNTDKPNPNTPLGWAESMYVVALQKVKELEANGV
jgi:hypothetical protein